MTLKAFKAYMAKCKEYGWDLNNRKAPNAFYAQVKCGRRNDEDFNLYTYANTKLNVVDVA